LFTEGNGSGGQRCAAKNFELDWHLHPTAVFASQHENYWHHDGSDDWFL